jgi:predicted ATPase
VAEELLETFADGVWFVDLAPLADPTLVPQAVATALGLQEWSGRPPEAALQEYLKARELLSILDNCEHLIEASAYLVHTLRRACPPLGVLATSREALGIVGERAYLVPALSMPPADDPQHLTGSRVPSPSTLLQHEAVRLFDDRAMAVQPSFQVTSDNAAWRTPRSSPIRAERLLFSCLPSPPANGFV